MEMDEICPDNYIVVYNTNGSIIMQEENVLLCRKKDEELIYVPSSIFLRNFQGEVNATSLTLQTTEVADPSTTLSSLKENEEPSRTYWSRTEILQLISLYKKHEKDFKSTTIKNEKVWNRIGENMSRHNADQCCNKFKYLKQKYLEKKDNLGSKSTGTRPIKFEYFEEMDSIFQREPNVAPVAIASSMKGKRNVAHINTITSTVTKEDTTNSFNVNDSETRNDEPAKKKFRHKVQANKLEDQRLKTYENIAQMKEEGRNRRHAEAVRCVQELTTTIQSLIKGKQASQEDKE